MLGIYEMTRPMRIAAIISADRDILRWRLRRAGIRNALHIPGFLWQASSRKNWEANMCCDGYACGCYGASNAEYYTTMAERNHHA